MYVLFDCAKVTVST